MHELAIKLEGYPEKVQRVADAIDAAFPDLMAWISCPEDTDGISIIIQGYELPVMPVRASRALAA
ncbi:MAG: hypothetical protein EOO77_15735 [Oxalobacteraceae bacterium]|nr:MAG: hypothetical protein EOO77_15735 [Oxalobacteraceae bacterium]